MNEKSQKPTTRFVYKKKKNDENDLEKKCFIEWTWKKTNVKVNISLKGKMWIGGKVGKKRKSKKEKKKKFVGENFDFRLF